MEDGKDLVGLEQERCIGQEVQAKDTLDEGIKKNHLDG